MLLVCTELTHLLLRLHCSLFPAELFLPSYISHKYKKRKERNSNKRSWKEKNNVCISWIVYSPAPKIIQNLTGLISQKLEFFFSHASVQLTKRLTGTLSGFSSSLCFAQSVAYFYPPFGLALKFHKLEKAK